jgi:hypothetical protein
MSDEQAVSWRRVVGDNNESPYRMSQRPRLVIRAAGRPHIRTCIVIERIDIIRTGKALGSADSQLSPLPR